MTRRAISIHSKVPPAETSPAISKPDDISESDWPTIGNKDQIPSWLRDNDYILNSHPMPTYSYLKSLRLWRCLHMETMNIWAHLLASLAFIAVSITLVNVPNHQTTPGDIYAFTTFLLSTTICYILSAGFHTLRSHSYTTHHLWGKMDILGICFLAFGAGSSMTYYAFYCRPLLRLMYWALNLFSAIGAGITLFDTGGGGNKMRTLRGAVFSLLAVSAMMPVLHCVFERGWMRAKEIGAGWYLAEGIALLIGVCVFVGRFPERVYPGWFDVWGHSHQIWHVCAVIGSGFHFMALVGGYTHSRREC